jgi:tripartite-type tricarboxylate transporter receptor subunit TctC
LPNVPTFTEAGYKDMDIGVWNAFLAPAGTPRDIVMKLNGAINEALADAAVEKEFSSRGMQPMRETPEQFADRIRTESRRMAGIVKASGAKLE